MQSVQQKQFVVNRDLASAHHAALSRGADELMAIAEFQLRGNPQALVRARGAYKTCCIEIARAIEEQRP